MPGHHLANDGSRPARGGVMHHRVLAAEHPMIAVGALDPHPGLVRGHHARLPQTRQRRVPAFGKAALGPRIALLSVIWIMGIAAYHATRLRLVGQRVGALLFLGSFAAWVRRSSATLLA